MSKEIKINLDTTTNSNLIAKAESFGFKGRGSIPEFIRKVANNPMIFLTPDLLSAIKKSS